MIPLLAFLSRFESTKTSDEKFCSSCGSNEIDKTGWNSLLSTECHRALSAKFVLAEGQKTQSESCQFWSAVNRKRVGSETSQNCVKANEIPIMAWRIVKSVVLVGSRKPRPAPTTANFLWARRGKDSHVNAKWRRKLNARTEWMDILG